MSDYDQYAKNRELLKTTIGALNDTVLLVKSASILFVNDVESMRSLNLAIELLAAELSVSHYFIPTAKAKPRLNIEESEAVRLARRIKAEAEDIESDELIKKIIEGQS